MVSTLESYTQTYWFISLAYNRRLTVNIDLTVEKALGMLTRMNEDIDRYSTLYTATSNMHTAIIKNGYHKQ